MLKNGKMSFIPILKIFNGKMSFIPILKIFNGKMSFIPILTIVISINVIIIFLHHSGSNAKVM
jgi:hypothetical protein